MNTTAHLVTLARLTTFMVVALAFVSLIFTVYRMVRIYRSGVFSRRGRSPKRTSGFPGASIVNIPGLEGALKIEPFHGGYRTSQNTDSSHIDVEIQQVKTPQQNVRVASG